MKLIGLTLQGQFTRQDVVVNGVYLNKDKTYWFKPSELSGSIHSLLELESRLGIKVESKVVEDTYDLKRIGIRRAKSGEYTFREHKLTGSNVWFQPKDLSKKEWDKLFDMSRLGSIDLIIEDDPFLVQRNDTLTKMLSPKILVPKYTRVVIIGASIMAGSHNTEARRKVAVDTYADNGITMEVVDRASSGKSTTWVLDNIDTLLDDLMDRAEETLVFLHIGGNDLSTVNPYPHNADTIESNVRAIIGNIKGRGMGCAMSPLTKRIDPSTKRSAPYNENIYIPLIKELLPEWVDSAGNPVIDLYNAMGDNPEWYSADGVHPSTAGTTGIATYIAQQISTVVPKDTVVEPSQPVTPPTVPGTYITDAVINISLPEASNGRNHMDGDKNKIIVNSDKTTVALNGVYNNVGDGSLVENATLSISGEIGGINTAGRAVEENDSGDLFDKGCTRDSVWTIGGAITVNLDSGVNPTDSYRVELLACRVTTDDRTGEYTVGGVTKEINGGLDPWGTDVWSGVTGQQLLDNGITFQPKSGVSYAYLNAFRITKE
ncbi:hypothetical protein GR7B_00017 [Vibrio phage vB_VcorM_GR7B]|nr:hypothetical protein GR7B_00017 [Vibrio phage vB_VcorM_GR7B]